VSLGLREGEAAGEAVAVAAALGEGAPPEALAQWLGVAVAAGERVALKTHCVTEGRALGETLGLAEGEPELLAQAVALGLSEALAVALGAALPLAGALTLALTLARQAVCVPSRL
jgi:hypothetical protein